MWKPLRKLSSIVLVSLAVPMLAGCGNLVSPPARMGMVKDSKTGLMFGSVVEKNLITDPSFYNNKKIKVRIRNTSGDVVFDIGSFRDQLRQAYESIGFEPTADDDFGLLVDVNVMYSGQIQTNLANEFAFLGAAAGGIAGYRSSTDAGTAIGTVAGATLGSILGSFITDDTYIVVAEVTFGIIKSPKKKTSKTITFSNSPGYYEDEDEKEYKEEIRKARGFKKTRSIGVSVFAGGRNVSQAQIAQRVRQRLVRIVSDII